jgi:hypothetical protein
MINAISERVEPHKKTRNLEQTLPFSFVLNYLLSYIVKIGHP